MHGEIFKYKNLKYMRQREDVILVLTSNYIYKIVKIFFLHIRYLYFKYLFIWINI